MNAEYFRDMLTALESWGFDLSKVRVKCMTKAPDGVTHILDSNGTCHFNIGEDSVGTVCIEFE